MDSGDETKEHPQFFYKNLKFPVKFSEKIENLTGNFDLSSTPSFSYNCIYFTFMLS